MATDDGKDIQDLLNQIVALKKALDTAGDDGRAKSKDIKVDEACKVAAPSDGKTFEPDVWGKIGEDRQKEARLRLHQIRDSLHMISTADGPSDPAHIMSGNYASTFAIVLWLIASFALVVGLVWGIVLLWGAATNTDIAIATESYAKAEATVTKAAAATMKAELDEGEARRTAGPEDHEKIELAAAVTREAKDRANAAEQAAKTEALNLLRQQPKSATETIVLTMVVLLGALGGSVHLVSSFVKYVGNRQLKRSWLPYYLSLPVAGASMAPIIYMLLRVGILTPSGSANGGSPTAELNLLGIYAFAAMTGMFAKTAADKLSEVFGTMFRTREASSKDAIGVEKPPGGAAQTVPKPQ